MAKLQIFHHNGQLAEFETDLVTGLQVIGEGFEDVNKFLHDLIDKPGVAPLPSADPPVVEPEPVLPDPPAEPGVATVTEPDPVVNEPAALTPDASQSVAEPVAVAPEANTDAVEGAPA